MALELKLLALELKVRYGYSIRQTVKGWYNECVELGNGWYVLLMIALMIYWVCQ